MYFWFLSSGCVIKLSVREFNYLCLCKILVFELDPSLVHHSVLICNACVELPLRVDYVSGHVQELLVLAINFFFDHFPVNVQGPIGTLCPVVDLVPFNCFVCPVFWS